MFLSGVEFRQARRQKEEENPRVLNLGKSVSFACIGREFWPNESVNLTPYSLALD